MTQWQYPWKERNGKTPNMTMKITTSATEESEISVPAAKELNRFAVDDDVFQFQSLDMLDRVRLGSMLKCTAGDVDIANGR
jgi:hypothetical protein